MKNPSRRYRNLSSLVVRLTLMIQLKLRGWKRVKSQPNAAGQRRNWFRAGDWTRGYSLRNAAKAAGLIPRY